MPDTAFVFPGQGSQYAGMGKLLAAEFAEARLTFEEADEALGFQLSKLCFEGPDEELRKTENTQPALLAVSIAAFRVLAANGYAADLVAGHSLGEYSALVAARALDFSSALRLVKKRGRYMQEAVPQGLGAMELAKAAGARRTVLLPVSAPFHCPLMRPAQERLRADLDGASFMDLAVPLINNWQAAEIRTAAEAREGLFEQIPNPVRWHDSMRLMAQKGITRVVEIGAGSVLLGLARNIDPSFQTLKFGEPGDLEKLRGAWDSNPNDR